MPLIARPTATNGQVQNDPWWPDIDLAELRASCRLDGTVTNERLINSVTSAVASINAELMDWQATQIVAGYTDSLAQVPSRQLAGTSVLHIHYRRAVYSAVQADLCQRYRDIDTTAAGERKAIDMDAQIDAFQRDKRWAIADLRGSRRTTVELI